MTKKAIEVTLTDGRVLQVKEPGMQELPSLLRALPAMDLIAKSYESYESATSNVIVPMPELTPGLLVPLYELLSAMSGLTVEEFTDLPLVDGMQMIMCLGELMPQNFTVQRVSLPLPVGSRE